MESDRPREIRRFLEEDGTKAPLPEKEHHRLLAGEEQILYQTGKHWIVFVKALLYLVLAIFLLAERGDLVRHIPYTSASEGAHAVTGTVAQQGGGERIVPAQTMDDIMRWAGITITWTVSGVCIALGIVLLFVGVARAVGFFSCQVMLTTKRVIARDALLGSFSSLSLANVESARADCGLLGPMLGYGKVAITMGSGRKVSLANIARPMEFERELFGAK